MTTGTALHQATEPVLQVAKLPQIDRAAHTRPLDSPVDASADTEPAERASLEPTVDDSRLAGRPASEPPGPASTPPPTPAPSTPLPDLALSAEYLAEGAPDSSIPSAATGWRRASLFLLLLFVVAVVVTLFLRFGPTSD